MIILRNSELAQTFNVIPREYLADSIKITGVEGVTTYAITSTQSGRYLTFDKIVTLIENQFYTLTVFNGTDVVYKDRIFCTNQTVSSYTINKQEYTETTSNNDFIIV
tara:strand:- start:229 stop:549 length:321 start_codon:yes stop_codon:yes gene_type:complete